MKCSKTRPRYGHGYHWDVPFGIFVCFSEVLTRKFHEIHDTFVTDVVGLRRAIKKFGIERFKKNCVLATEGFDWVMTKMFSPAAGGSAALPNTTNKKSETPRRSTHVPSPYPTKLEQ